MIDKLARGTKRALGLHHPGRNLDVFPDDVFLISYPKSGNTWTRFLIANLVYPQARTDFSNINKIIPDPEGLSKRCLNRLPRPRFIKSHQYFDPRYPTVIYVVRDPRDVALSQYHFHRKRRLIEDDFPMELFVKRFVAGKTSPYGSWGENVVTWLATRQNRPGFLLLRYEDMVHDTLRELTKVVAFLGMDVAPERVSEAVEKSSVNEMRRLEQQQAHLWSSTKDTRQDVPFVRSAKPDGWRSSFSEAAIADLESAWGPLMEYLGYDLARAEPGSRAAIEPMLSGPRV